jgi:hypothetical protein
VAVSNATDASPRWGECTLRAPSCTFGFLFPIRLFNARMASLGGTAFERMVSDISRFSGMFSLEAC